MFSMKKYTCPEIEVMPEISEDIIMSSTDPFDMDEDVL